MKKITIHEARGGLRKENSRWKWAAIGLLILSAVINLVLCAAIGEAGQAAAAWEQRYYTAASIAHDAVQAYEELLGQVEEDREARDAQAAAYAAISDYQYIGECTITAYCPCEECCGPWADGLTATGIPATPGIVAVDPEVIPLGASVVIDGRQYLAADVGGAVKGLHVDVCLPDHQDAVTFGVQTAAVWMVTPDGGGQDG